MQSILRINHVKPAVMAAIVVTTLWMCATRATADFVIDFEHSPFPTIAQPDNFAAAGAMQTYTQVGEFSITGGVVLGNPTFLTAFPANGTPPNLYGTTDIADPSLLDTITIEFPASALVTGVNGILFNGQPIPEDYDINAFSGATPLVGWGCTGVPDNSNTNAFCNFLLASNSANPITRVTITTPNAANNGWDFLVDSIQVTQGRQGVPEPGSAVLAACAAILAGLWILRRRMVTNKLPINS